VNLRFSAVTGRVASFKKNAPRNDSRRYFPVKIEWTRSTLNRLNLYMNAMINELLRSFHLRIQVLRSFMTLN